MNLSDFLGSGGGPDVWASGKTVQQYAYVVSPADLEIYQRKTATGSGATDPYSDTTNYRPVSIDRLSSISNAWSGGAWTNPGVDSSFVGANTAAPTLAAGVRTALLSVTGKGSLDFCAMIKGGTQTISGTFRAEIVVDGRSVFDATFGTPGNYNYAILHGGAAGSSGNIAPIFMPCPFSNSLQVYITSSSGTNRIQFMSAYRGVQS